MNNIGEKLRILIVDDNKFVRDHLCRILEEKYICETAGSKDDALKKFKIAEKQHYAYDLILLDNYLPEPDAGIEVLRYVSENNIDSITLMLSEHTESESDPFKTGIKAFKAGAIDFLPKPFKREYLETKIDNLISKKKQALAIIRMAETMGVERFENELHKIMDDDGIDMMTKLRVKKLSGEVKNTIGNEAFLVEPRDIEVSDSPGKSHNSMWNRRIKSIKDIPADAQISVFNVLASHKQIYKIKFGSYGPSGVQHTYRLRIKPPKIGEGKLYCTLFGPSPINCARQDLIIFVDAGFEEKVKRDVEKKLGEQQLHA
ncbi:MAG: response regulator [Spirochaetales bacterium]|nr:response regulator [Spirochaetales bacterium]